MCENAVGPASVMPCSALVASGASSQRSAKGRASRRPSSPVRTRATVRIGAGYHAPELLREHRGRARIAPGADLFEPLLHRVEDLGLRREHVEALVADRLEHL